MRRRRECEQRRGAQAVEIHLAVDVREKIDSDAGADAFFIAQQEYFFELGESAAVDRKYDFIDDVMPQEVGELCQGPHWIFRGEFHFLRRRFARLSKKCAELDAIRGGLLDLPSDA